jgi:hypothetical protein
MDSKMARKRSPRKSREVRAAMGHAAWLAHEEEEHPLHTEVTI